MLNVFTETTKLCAELAIEIHMYQVEYFTAFAVIKSHVAKRGRVLLLWGQVWRFKQIYMLFIF